ncbi:Branched-chain amino acid transport system / permease component, putative [Burkholderia thailandensis E264]|uniref:Branched-chain amino acid transport system / permease component, putative n=1 Tax=Burkholderia thailandensis (strain ATCC 700388 / DSM 13276 / CCUG 48851 / CIP 106301 / E264) TaxID=271848 RepID=Q2T2I7_BURTA|nr:Branched-chain amino acid transport system / permease component, putative [Burkholderia thailandensis E264]
MLYRASGVLNFAFGATGALGAYVAAACLDAGYPQALAWGAAIAASTAASLVYGLALAPRLAARDRVVRSIATLGFALVLLGFCEWYWGDTPRRLVLPTDSEALDFGDVRFTYTRIVGLALAFAMMAAIGVVLARTRLGLQMRALSNDRHLSGLLGIRVLRVDVAAWAISGVFAGITGLLLGNLVRLQAAVLTFLVIPAFAAAIVGRLASLPATVAAGVAIGLAEALAITVPGFAPYRSATPFLIALVAMLFIGSQSSGHAANES